MTKTVRRSKLMNLCINIIVKESSNWADAFNDNAQRKEYFRNDISNLFVKTFAVEQQWFGKSPRCGFKVRLDDVEDVFHNELRFFLQRKSVARTKPVRPSKKC